METNLVGIMKITLLVITFGLGVAGWLKPEKAPVWLEVSVVGAMVLALVFEIVLELKASTEASELRVKIAELHASETARAKFELSVNGTMIDSRDQWVQASEKSGEWPFVLKLRNIGAASATDVQAFLWVPEDVKIPYLGKHWIINGAPIMPGSSSGERVEGVSEYAFIAPVTINSNNWLTTGQGRLPRFQQGTTVPFRLKVYAGGGVFQEWTFGIRS